MMTGQYHFLFLICSVVMLLYTENPLVYAQDTCNNSKTHLYWLDGGFGFSSAQFPEGIPMSMGVCFSYQTGGHLLSIRSIYNTEAIINIGWGGEPHPENVWDVGALYGQVAKATYGFASISGGISIVGGVRQKVPFNTTGIPIECQLFWTPNSFFGIGIYGFANLNPRESFVGGLLCIQVGKLE